MINPPNFDFDRDFLAEYLSELNQDDARDGFQNLGSANNVVSVPTSSTTSFFLNTQGGADTIQMFGTGNDTIYTGSGSDTIFAGRGDDTVYAGSGNDTLTGFDGNDKLHGGSGADTFDAGIGNDELYGGSGNDTMFAGAGTDILYGGGGDDKLFGDHDGSATSQQGNDTLVGGAGRDILSGGGGADTLIGGADGDTFTFETARDLSIGHTDFIRDFARVAGDPKASDMIDLRGIDAVATVAGNQIFDFVNGPSSQAGTVWLTAASGGQQKVMMNVDGGNADVSIIVKFDAGTTSLLESDFFL